MVRMKVYLPERMVKELEELKGKLEISMNEIIRRAIDEYIESHRRRFFGPKL